MKQGGSGVRQIMLVCVLPLLMGQTPLAGQSPDASVSALAAQAGVIQQPFAHLRGTKPLTLPTGLPLPPEMTYPKRGSIYAVQFRQEVDYWLHQIAATPARRDKIWNPDFSSPDPYRASLQKHRSNLRAMLGLLDLSTSWLRSVSSVLQSGPIRIEDVTITLDEDFVARALLFVPEGEVSGAVIAIPGINESREEFAGIAEGQEPAPWLKSLLDRRLAAAVAMTVEHTSDDYVKVRTSYDQQDRRFLLHRLGFIVGRTLVGLEVQQTQALRDYLVSHFNLKPQRVALLGQGQGGMTALYAAAVDEDYWGASVVDYFQQRENCWQEAPDRELYGQLNEFGDAEVAALIAPRPLHISCTAGGAIPDASVQGELARARRFYAGLGKSAELTEREAPAADVLADAANVISSLGTTQSNLASSSEIALRVSSESIQRARDEQFEKLHRYLARLDAKSDEVRAKRWRLLTTPASERAKRAEELRQDLRQLEGTVEIPPLPLNPRTKLIQVTDKFVAYDILLDTVPGVEAYGQLLVPRGQTSHLPAVICQHGLGGTPADITGVGSEPSVYHSLGSHLADLGYVVFAPYINVPIRQEILVDRLARQAAALGKMRTSLELAKLHRIVDFLQSLPFVDSQRIAYYGLSYGGYSAIWMPPLEPRIKADVISGHFNDWRAKITEENATPFVSPEGKHYTYPTSFLLHPGADNFNWNVLNRFTHVELIASMWPRPVCVEYGDYDTTTTPQWHARAWGQVEEYKKAWGLDGLVANVVRVHYNGIHEIHGVGTVDFLNRWIRPERPAGRDYAYDRLEQPHGTSGLSDASEATLPYVTHHLDMNPDTAVEGRFYVSSLSPLFTGMALRLSRAGHPGDVVVRFGSAAGRGDLGEARIAAEAVHPLSDLWYTAKVQPVRLDPAKLYFFWVGTESGRAPENSYIVYGPRPYGGKDVPPNFGLSYQVLTKGKNGLP